MGKKFGFFTRRVCVCVRVCVFNIMYTYQIRTQHTHTLYTLVRPYRYKSYSYLQGLTHIAAWNHNLFLPFMYLLINIFFHLAMNKDGEKCVVKAVWQGGPKRLYGVCGPKAKCKDITYKRNQEEKKILHTRTHTHTQHPAPSTVHRGTSTGPGTQIHEHRSYRKVPTFI